MAELMGSGLPASLIMERDPGPKEEGKSSRSTAGRNDPCPCGSGRKFKKCCAALQLRRQ
jgi:uncharacterized protein YecA (UPF0149 family)